MKKHEYFISWIEKQLEGKQPKPVNFFTTFGHLNRIMNSIEDDKGALSNYNEEEIRVARALMQMSNAKFLDEISKLDHQTVELSGDGIQVLRWFKDRDLNNQGNLVSNLGFLTDVIYDQTNEQACSWDRQTVRVARMAAQLSNDELITILLNWQFKPTTQQPVSKWGVQYLRKNELTNFYI
ncbi:hypothetical protein BSQ38_02180 [Pediococcus damnosus]|uniref:hypothetical protein n=1 Tax=Pediococcus damnosus TaxID=51663 RepID=UPI000C1C9123|nr:hypothetical protein [Pediococcus damnosus]PIO80530.1 hypothetical protein BSQ38_02180 [Pediococcus damnosus]